MTVQIAGPGRRPVTVQIDIDVREIDAVADLMSDCVDTVRSTE